MSGEFKLRLNAGYTQPLKSMGISCANNHLK